MSNCATEVKFVKMLLSEFVGDVRIPSVMHEDNTGAIFMVHNNQVSARTKHIDIKYHHVKEMVEDGSLQVQYIKSEANPADVMTKNVKEVTHRTHTPNIFNGTLVNTKNAIGMLAQGGCQEYGTRRSRHDSRVCPSSDTIDRMRDYTVVVRSCATTTNDKIMTQVKNNNHLITKPNGSLMNQTDETDVCDVKEDQLNDTTVENNSKWITVNYKKKKKNTKIYRTNKINQRNKN